MNILLTFYVLIWPALVALTLLLISIAVVRDARRARKQGESLV